MRTLISEHPGFACVAEVSDTDELYDALEKQQPHVLIVDHCCDDCFSIQVITSIRKKYPALNILVISHEKTAEEIRKIIGIGIKNYLLKDCDEREITEAITCCAKGVKYFCGQIVDVLLEKELSAKEHCETGGITERELEIIQLLVSGRRPKEIADELSISPFTVNTHRRNIYKKLGITHSYELAKYAIKTGLMK